MLSKATVRLTWEDRSDHETSFVIEMRRAGQARFKRVARVSENVDQLAITGLTPGTSYTFRVRAEAGQKTLKPSNQVTVATPTPSRPRTPDRVRQ